MYELSQEYKSWLSSSALFLGCLSILTLRRYCMFNKGNADLIFDYHHSFFTAGNGNADQGSDKRKKKYQKTSPIDSWGFANFIKSGHDEANHGQWRQNSGHLEPQWESVLVVARRRQRVQLSDCLAFRAKVLEWICIYRERTFISADILVDGVLGLACQVRGSSEN